jgi:spermidine synthase
MISFGRAGDLFRLYEINPLVLDLARSQFTFLSATPARTETALGDARRVLEDEPPQSFDILIIDAFSGDSVPVHLLTREAFAAYFRQLKPDGILVVNITNRYLNLAPVVAGSAAALGKAALLFEYRPPQVSTVCFSASWMLVMEPARLAASGSYFSAGRLLPPQPGFRTWTDDYSSLFAVLH